MANSVYLMLSGGVDSSVAALDLIEEGYEVTGIYMQCWDSGQLEKIGLDSTLYTCNSKEDESDARVVAKQLGIKFESWDLKDKYFNGVVDNMLNGYKSGITPNPDVMCNSVIKFGVFADNAFAAGADYIATGHYVRRNSAKILRGLDTNKDQSYFLWKVDNSILQKSLFPIGEYISKVEVRDRAKKAGLITESKADSQGICFIGETPLREILLKVFDNKEGDIVDINGKILGKHQGALLYTIGQRNLGLSGGPWYVKSIDVEKNIVVIVHKDNKKFLEKFNLKASDINLHKPRIFFDSKINCKAQIRYRQNAVDCEIELINNKFLVTFKSPVSAVAPGQSVVFYKEDEMLAGGIIDQY